MKINLILKVAADIKIYLKIRKRILFFLWLSSLRVGKRRGHVMVPMITLYDGK